MNKFQLDAVQAAIKQFEFDGWLLYDFRVVEDHTDRALRSRCHC